MHGTSYMPHRVNDDYSDALWRHGLTDIRHTKRGGFTPVQDLSKPFFRTTSYQSLRDGVRSPTRYASPSPSRSVSTVDLEEERGFFRYSTPYVVFDPKISDPYNRWSLPEIRVFVELGSGGAPAENWKTPSGDADENLLCTPEHECGLTPEEEYQIALDQELWDR
eukprot:Sspe_Gene.75267::Locus_47030_Transcript_1_1_Confidence_1.000_Length_565::g.75267::m.75267